MRRLMLGTVLLLLIFSTTPARAGEKPAEMPAVVVRVKSLDALLQNLGLVVKLVGQENAAHQIEAVIKSKIGKKGIEGIDPTRPLGAYVRFGKEIDDLTGAILIPIADRASFLGMLDNLGIKTKKDSDDIYTHRTNQNVDLYFRFANQYLYMTGVKTDSIKDKVLLDPAKALAVPGDATFSVLARIDQIPEAARTIALIKVQEAIDVAKKKTLPNETKVQEAFRAALLDDVNKLTHRVINQAADVRFDLDVSEKTSELFVNVAISAKPKSELANSISQLGNLKSPFARLAPKNLAFHGAVHAALPDGLHKAFERVVDEAVDESIKGIQDPTKKKQADALFKALLPTAKAGEYHIAGAVVGPTEERFTFIGAVMLKDGVKLGAAIHELIADAVKQIPEEERGKIQLDAEKVGAVSIHRFEVPKNVLLDPLIDEVAGDKNLYIAFRDDAVFLALGKEALPILKAVLGQSGNAASLPLSFDVDVARMAKWLAKTPKQREQADKILLTGQASRVRLTIEGGETLRFSARAHFNVLEFLMKVADEKEK